MVNPQTTGNVNDMKNKLGLQMPASNTTAQRMQHSPDFMDYTKSVQNPSSNTPLYRETPPPNQTNPAVSHVTNQARGVQQFNRVLIPSSSSLQHHGMYKSTNTNLHNASPLMHPQRHGYNPLPPNIVSDHSRGHPTSANSWQFPKNMENSYVQTNQYNQEHRGHHYPPLVPQLAAQSRPLYHRPIPQTYHHQQQPMEHQHHQQQEKNQFQVELDKKNAILYQQNYLQHSNRNESLTQTTHPHQQHRHQQEFPKQNQNKHQYHSLISQQLAFKATSESHDLSLTTTHLPDQMKNPYFHSSQEKLDQSFTYPLSSQQKHNQDSNNKYFAQSRSRSISGDNEQNKNKLMNTINSHNKPCSSGTDGNLKNNPLTQNYLKLKKKETSIIPTSRKENAQGKTDKQIPVMKESNDKEKEIFIENATSTHMESKLDGPNLASNTIENPLVSSRRNDVENKNHADYLPRSETLSPSKDTTPLFITEPLYASKNAETPRALKTPLPSPSLPPTPMSKFETYHNPTSAQTGETAPGMLTPNQVLRAMPSDASCIFHILDRRLNFDTFDRDASFYSLIRSWVQDDPYRKVPLNVNASLGNFSVQRPKTYKSLTQAVQTSTSTFDVIAALFKKDQNTGSNDHDDGIGKTEKKEKQIKRKCYEHSELLSLHVKNAKRIRSATVAENKLADVQRWKKLKTMMTLPQTYG